MKGAADTNADGAVSLREAFNHTYDNVRQATGEKQHPVLIGTLPNDLVLRALKKAHRPGTRAVPAAR